MKHRSHSYVQQWCVAPKKAQLAQLNSVNLAGEKHFGQACPSQLRPPTRLQDLFNVREAERSAHRLLFGCRTTSGSIDENAGVAANESTSHLSILGRYAAVLGVGYCKLK